MFLNKINLKSILIFIIVCLVFIQINLSYAGTVVVKPGRFDHFTLQIPHKMIAGENFIIKVQAYDSSNNLIINFPESGKVFRVNLNGSATIQPSTLSAASFSGGTANISINSKKAEKIIFSIRESGGTVPVISRNLTIKPNKLDHFILQAVKSVTAGNSFDVRVIAKDLFDNTVNDLDIGRNIKITSTGTSSVKVVGSSVVDFRNGIATVRFVSEKTGNVVIGLQEVSTGSRGRTENIIINPSSLSYFKLQAPKSAVTGEAFDLLVAAYDSYDNIITNYSAVGSGIRLYTTGDLKIEPSFIHPSEFKNGQSVIKVVYEKAEEIQIIAKESNREQSGKTTKILISNAAPDHFVVVTPDTAVSGQRFKIKVEAYDRFNNLVRNYNLIGNVVILNSSGTGTISPSKISPSVFRNGIAMVDVIYDKAESFLVSAKMMGDTTQRKITLKKYKPKKGVPHTKAVQKTPKRSPEKTRAIAKSKTAKTKTKKAVKHRAIEHPKKVVREVPVTKVTRAKPQKKEIKEEIKPKKVVKKTVKVPAKILKKAPLKKVVKVDPEKKKIKKAIKPKKVVKVTTRKEPVKVPAKILKKALPKKVVKAEPEKKEIKKEIKPRETAIKESKKPVLKLAKKENGRVEKPTTLFRIRNISIIEAKNKAMLVFNITNPNGHLEFTDEIVSRYGKEWLRLKMNPAISTTKKSVTFESAFVGEVLFEEDKEHKNVLKIYVELLPSEVTFDIARVRNTLIVTLSNP